MIEPDAGDKTRWSSGPAVTAKDAEADLPPELPETVCAPAAEAVQLAPAHDPSGPIEKTVLAVTSPNKLFAASNACAVKLCEPPATIDADPGLTTM